MKFSRSIVLLLIVAATAFAGETVTIDGVTYEDVTWGRVTRTTVTFRHRTGVATIPLNQLPPEIRQRLVPSAPEPAVTDTNTSRAPVPASTTAEPSRAASDDFLPTPLNLDFELRATAVTIAFGVYVWALLWVNRTAAFIGAPRRLWNTIAFVFNVPGILAFAAMYAYKKRERVASLPRGRIKFKGFSLTPARVGERTESPLAVLDADGSPVSIKTDKKSRPVIETVKGMLATAIDSRASDVHIEPSEADVLVRLRVDGVMQPKQTLGRDIGIKVMASLKAFANVDVADRRKSQDGRFQVNYAGRTVDFRLATSSSIYGENIVLRLLDRSTGVKSLEELGMSPQILREFETALGMTNGMILVAGPTGSGKTSTVYAALRRFNPATKKIITVEDPVEYELPGAIQIPVNVKAGVTYEEGLKSVMRQDPDVILVGEMRSKVAAEVAIRAALTGHLVFSTIHAPSAVGTVSRLRDMGIEPYLISSALIAVVSQRLVRRLCNDCKEAFTPVGVADGGHDGGRVLYRAHGCPNCDNVGYRGRIGVFELLMLDSEFKKMVMAGADDEAMFQYARSMGMTTMREDAEDKIAAGISTLQEAAHSVKM